MNNHLTTPELDFGTALGWVTSLLVVIGGGILPELDINVGIVELADDDALFTWFALPLIRDRWKPRLVGVFDMIEVKLFMLCEKITWSSILF